MPKPSTFEVWFDRGHGWEYAFRTVGWDWRKVTDHLLRGCANDIRVIVKEIN